jgi:MFS family permease
MGPRRLYLAGTALVGLAGLLGLLAQDLGTLVAARVLLGLGTCAGYPSAMYLVRSEARRTGQDSPAGILTVLSLANQTVSVLGPTLGGLLIGTPGWRGTFAINIPLALACLWLGASRLPHHDARPSTEPRPRLDLLGTALFGILLVSALLVLLERRTDLWPLLVVSGLATIAFVVVELRAADPFVDLRLLAGNAALVATHTRNLLSATVTYVFLFGFTQWLQDGRGLGPEQAGLIIVPTFLTAIGLAATTGRRPRIRGKLVVGGVAQVAAAVTLLLVGDDTPVLLLVGVAVLVGVPQGLLNLANQNALYHQADPARTASSAGLLRTSVYVGALLSAAAVGAVTVADRSLARVGRVSPGTPPASSPSTGGTLE